MVIREADQSFHCLNNYVVQSEQLVYEANPLGRACSLYACTKKMD